MRLTKWKSWSSLPRKLSRLDHPCTNLPVKPCIWEKALTFETFPRGDYKKLCELLVFYLGDVPGFHCLQQKQGIVTAVQTNVLIKVHWLNILFPESIADALYNLTLRMTQNITKAINEDEKISICYAPWFLKSYMVNKAPSNDLSALKSSFHIRDHYPRLRQALLASIQRHCWYLSEHLVLLALAND